MQTFLQVGKSLVRPEDIQAIDMSQLEKEHYITVFLPNRQIRVEGIPALTLIYKLQPSALEGLKGLKYGKQTWVIHNLFGHPALQVLAWMGQHKLGFWIHDVLTSPQPKGFKG